MGSNRPHYFAIGIFVLSAIVLGIAGILVFGSDRMSSPKYFIESYFDESVSGVDIGTPVRFRGVDIGNVTKIELTGQAYKTHKMYVLVRSALGPEIMRSRPDIIKSIRKSVKEEGLRVKLVSQGITGLYFLEMDYDPSVPADRLSIDWKPKYCVVPSAPSTTAKLRETVDRLTTQIDQIDIAAIGEHTENITANLEKTSSDLTTFISHLNAIDIKGIAGEIHRTSANLEASSADIRRITKAASGEMLADARETFDKLPTISSNLVESTTRVNEILDSSGEKVDIFLINLNNTLEDLNDLIRLVKRYPGVLLREPPEEEIGPKGRRK